MRNNLFILGLLSLYLAEGVVKAAEPLGPNGTILSEESWKKYFHEEILRQEQQIGKLKRDHFDEISHLNNCNFKKNRRLEEENRELNKLNQKKRVRISELMLRLRKVTEENQALIAQINHQQELISSSSHAQIATAPYLKAKYPDRFSSPATAASQEDTPKNKSHRSVSFNPHSSHLTLDKDHKARAINPGYKEQEIRNRKWAEDMEGKGFNIPQAITAEFDKKDFQTEVGTDIDTEEDD